MSFAFFTQYVSQFKSTEFPEPSESKKCIEDCKTIISKYNYVLNKFNDSVYYKLFLFAISKCESFVDFVEFPVFSKLLNLKTKIDNDLEDSKLILESVNKIKIALESHSKTVDICEPETIVSNAKEFLNKFDISESKSHRAIRAKYTDFKSESESNNYNDIIKNINSDLIDLEIPKFKGTAPINPSRFKRNTNEHDTQYKIKLNEYIIARTQYETESKAHIEKYKQYILFKADLNLENNRLDEEYMEKMYKSLHESIDEIDEHDLYICKFIQSLDYDKILQIFEITKDMLQNFNRFVDLEKTIMLKVSELQKFIKDSDNPDINDLTFINNKFISKISDMIIETISDPDSLLKIRVQLYFIKAVSENLSSE